MFDINLATSPESIAQLKSAYHEGWGGSYTMVDLYTIWYYNDSVNDEIVHCRTYYHFIGIYEGYWINNMDYNTTTNLWEYVGGGVSGNAKALKDTSGISSEELALLTRCYPYETIVLSTTCFLANTQVQTSNHGLIAIEKLIAGNHMIYNKPIIAITQTIFSDKFLICFNKNSLGKNIPSEKTIMTPLHKILIRGKLKMAQSFVNSRNIIKVPYTGEILYNVLLQVPYIMRINNLFVETLHPANKIAKLAVESFLQKSTEVSDKNIMAINHNVSVEIEVI